MPVDPRMFAPFDLGEIMERGQRMQHNRMILDERREERDRKRRLGDLLPIALGRGGNPNDDGPLPSSWEQADEGWRAAFDEARQNDPSIRSFDEFLKIQHHWRNSPRYSQGGQAGTSEQRSAIDQIAGLDPDLFIKLDDRQKAQAKEEVKDLTAAVRWADNPEKWSYVQQHFGQKGIDLTPYDYTQRERGMLALGKIGEYLDSAPKVEIRATEPGGGLYSIQGDQVRVLVQPNDGSAQMGAPSQGGGVREGATATNPQTGQKIVYRNGQWVPVNGGPTPSASGGFPSSGY